MILADFGDPVVDPLVDYFLTFRLSVYLMKIMPLTRRALYIWYERFYYKLDSHYSSHKRHIYVTTQSHYDYKIG